MFIDSYELFLRVIEELFLDKKLDREVSYYLATNF